jgi:hypothetical protein
VKQSTFDAMLAERASYEADDDPDQEKRDARKGATLLVFEAESKRGITWVPVPDDDPDHQGSVFQKEETADA